MFQKKPYTNVEAMNDINMTSKAKVKTHNQTLTI